MAKYTYEGKDELFFRGRVYRPGDEFESDHGFFERHDDFKAHKPAAKKAAAAKKKD